MTDPAAVLAAMQTGLEVELGDLLAPFWAAIGFEVHVENLFAFMPDDQREQAEQIWALLTAEAAE
jgi:hypothetical protein